MRFAAKRVLRSMAMNRGLKYSRVEKFGGKHHGYFMPHEGANNIAHTLFSFPSLAAYENYRIKAVSV